MISRSEVMHRAQSVWRYASVPYSMATIHQPDGYRQDCSGYVSMCWRIPLDAPGSWGGLNTVTLVTGGWMREIPVADLRPGDAVGRCGPGTAGAAGHIQLFGGWVNEATREHYVYEQAGGTSGPRWRRVKWTPGYRAYRLRGIVDDIDDDPADDRWEDAVKRMPEVRQGQRGDAVRKCQSLLAANGYPPRNSFRRDGTPDGIAGDGTGDAIAAFQRARGLVPDRVCGVRTWSELLVKGAGL